MGKSGCLAIGYLFFCFENNAWLVVCETIMTSIKLEWVLCCDWALIGL